MPKGKYNRSKSNSGSKKSSESNLANQNNTIQQVEKLEHLRWRQVDDLRLIEGVQQVPSLVQVYRGYKFSRPYSLRELEERWKSLLFDKNVSKEAIATINGRGFEPIISSDTALWCSIENDLLLTITKSEDKVNLNDFEKLKNKNLDKFHHSRTPKQMHQQWSLINYLKETKYDSKSTFSSCSSFSEFEDYAWSIPFEHLQVDGLAVDDPKYNIRKQELHSFDRIQRRKGRILAEEVNRWGLLPQNTNLLLPNESGNLDKKVPVNRRKVLQHDKAFVKFRFFASDSEAIAMLRGARKLVYRMTTQEIVIGRGDICDVDLTEEGPTSKISRIQATIKLKDNCEFYLENHGRRCIYICGQPCLTGGEVLLANSALIEIGLIKVMFKENAVLMTKVRAAVLGV